MLTLSEQVVVHLEHRRIDAAQRELAARDARLELGEHRPSCRRPEAGLSAGTRRAPMSARSSSGVTSGQSTGRTRHVSCVAARSPAMTPKTGARSSAPSSSTGNGSASASSALPTAMHLVADLAQRSARRARRASRRETTRAPSASRTARTRRRRAARPSRLDDPPRLGVDGDTAVAHPAAERHAAIGRELDRERRRRADRDEDRAAGDGRLLHELEREPSADAEHVRRERQQSPSRNAQPTTLSIALWRPTSSRTHSELAVGVEEPGRVQAAGRRERALRLAQSRRAATR